MPYVPAPYAVDAQGADIEVEMGIEGDTLVLRVPHHEADVAYPLLVDPAIYEDWVNPGVRWIDGVGLSALTNGTWLYTETGSWIEGSTACIYACWGGSGRGLFVSMPSGTQWEQQYGHWAYTAPNTSSYLAGAWANPFVRNDHGCPRSQYPQPHDYVGMWYQGQWNRALNNQAVEVGSVDIASWGEAFILGLATGPGSSSSYMPCWRDLYVGGAVVWLDDWADPSVQSVSGYPSGWINGSTQFTLSTTATDAGLGIQGVDVYPQGTVQVKYPQSSCSGGKTSLCPTTLPVSFTLTGNSFLEGERPASLDAHDPTGGYSNTSAWTMRVDKTPPDIALSGQLAEETDESGEKEQPAGEGDKLSLPVYNLTIEAEDGPTAPNPEPRDKRSGVKDIQVFLDGVQQEVPWEPQSCPESSCPMTETYKLILSKLTTAGKHTLEILAIDQVGNKTPQKRTIEFEYFPVTGIKDEYVMHYFPLPDGHGNEAEEEHPDRPELAVNVMNGNLVYREQDIEVEGSGVDLEVERYYNSMLPQAEDTEWGDGWMLAQTPDLDLLKTGGSQVPNEARVLDSSGSIEAGVGLPTEAGAQVFDPALRATLTKKSSGGYELRDETGESATSIAFDDTGQTEALLSGGYAKVDYSYESGHLSEIEVSDPATFAADPEELAIPKAEPITAPVFSRAFGSFGSGNGQLRYPGDVAVDAQGNLWVVDKSNHRVQKFDEEGNFLAKFGSFGWANGQLNRPTAIAIAPNGDLLVADSGNNRVQRFSPTGAYLSKFGSQGTGNGQFAGLGPEGIAVDAEGYIWVSDTHGGRLQKFNSAGALFGGAGSPGEEPTQLGEPAGLDVDSAGNVWVTDRQNNRVSVFTANGDPVTEFGSYGSSEGEFDSPTEIAIDRYSNVWVGDQDNDRVQRFDIEGHYLGQFGTAGTGEGQLSLGYSMGIAADSKDRLWITDTNNQRVQEWLAPIEEPPYSSSFSTTRPGDGQLQSPGDVAVGVEGNLWVADAYNDRIQRFDPSGEFLARFGATGSDEGEFSRPTAIAVDRDGNLLVVDTGNHRVQKFDSEGEFISEFGSYGSGDGQFDGPEGIATDFAGNLWVADTQNGRIQKFDEEGNFLAVVGSYGQGPGQLREPIGIDVDASGDVWVVDQQNSRVSVFDSDGEFLREFGFYGSGEGGFNGPEEIEVDRAGNIWVGDPGNNCIQRFDLEGQYLGQLDAEDAGEGQFNFSYPMGIATDSSGHLWVAGADEDRIQKWLLERFAPAQASGLDLSDGDAAVDVQTEGGLVSAITGNAAGEHSYDYEGDFLVSHEGPQGEVLYEKDSANRLAKVTLPNGTWGSIAYYAADGRVKSVTVAPEGANPKTTYFEYSDEPRRTFVEVPGQPNLTYDIGKDGSVLKWWNKQQPPQLLNIEGSLWVGKETEIATGDHTLAVIADSPEGIASIQFIANGYQLVDEKTCQQDPEEPGIECTKLENAWVVNTGDLTPGILPLEVIVTDSDGNVESERFWVNVPYTPPPPAGADAEPRFKDVLTFREEFGLEVVFPVASESELNERIFDLLHAWHNPHTPAGEVARASWEKWGVPLRPEDVAELEYREAYVEADATAITQWARSHAPLSYAGYTVDHRAGGIVHIGFTGGAEAQAALVQALKSSGLVPAAERIVPMSTPSTNSLHELAQTADLIGDNLTVATISQVSIDPENAVVKVGAWDVSQAQAWVNAHVSSNVPLEVFEAKWRGKSGRFTRKGPLVNGQLVVDEYHEDGERWRGRCTLGYGAHEPMGKAQNGSVKQAYFALIAAHCGRDLGEKWGRVNAFKVKEDPAELTPIGVLKRRSWEHPVHSKVTDVEAIRLESGLAPPRTIYKKGGDLPVEGVAKIVPYMHICSSGAASDKIRRGTMSPEVILMAIPTDYDENEYPTEWSPLMWEPMAHLQSIDGDSGGPIWKCSTNEALGLISSNVVNRPWTGVAPLLPPPPPDPTVNPASSIIFDPEEAPGILAAPGMGDIQVTQAR